MKNFFKWVSISIVSFVTAAAMAFFFAIGCGVVPMAQDFWVETAMTTFHHHWLAQLMVSPEVIDEHEQMLMEQNKKQDQISADGSNVNVVVPEDPDVYLEEGYYKHSDGVYIKEVTGSATGGKYTGYLMLCPDPSRVKLVDTHRQFSCGEQVHSMIERSGAVAGINGGGFVDGADFSSNGGTPYGILIEDGELVCGYPGGYYRLVGISEDNKMAVGKFTGKQAMDLNLRSAVTAEMVLIANGVKQKVGGWGIAPRTALGQRATGEVIFLVVDGRHAAHSSGCDLSTLADVLYEEGCVNAAMLDGGASSVMETATYDEEGNCTVKLVNRPDLGHNLPEDQRLPKQRWINNAWVIMPPTEETE